MLKKRTRQSEHIGNTQVVAPLCNVQFNGFHNN